MKQLVIFSIFLITLFSGCSGEDERIEKFENVLGESEAAALNTIVDEFDKFLGEAFTYQSIEDSRKTYIELFAYGSPSFNFNENRFVELSRLNMESGLKSALGHYPDSVWIKNDSVYYIYDF